MRRLLGSLCVGFLLFSTAGGDQPAPKPPELTKNEQLFREAVQQFEKRDYARSIALLEQILKDFPQSTTASRAMLGLAEVYGAKKDRAKQLNWLQRCAAFDKTEPTGRGIMDTDNTRSVAVQRLARFHEEEGRWPEARKWWTAWEPKSWCGTCLMSMRAERQRHIGLCLLHEGEHVQAAKHLLSAVQQGEDGGPLALMLFDLYRQANQLQDVEAMADSIAKKTLAEWEKLSYFVSMPKAERERALPVWPLREAIRIWRMARPRTSRA